MCAYFKQIRRIPDMGSLVRELADRLNRNQAEDGVEETSTMLRLQTSDADNLAMTDADGPNVLNGSKTDTDTIAHTDTDGPNDLDTLGEYQYTQSATVLGPGVTQPGKWNFSDWR